MPNKDITLYLDGSAPPPVVVVTEADTDWTFRFTVMYNNAVYAPTVNYVILAGHKPDGNAFAYQGSKSGNLYQCACNVQMTAAPGDVRCTLHLLGSRNTGLDFILRVQPGAAGTAPVASVTSLPAYTTILSQLSTLINTVDSLPDDVPAYVSNWLAQNLTSDGSIAVDKSLSVSGAAADAKTAGDRLKALETAQIVTDATLRQAGAAADAKAVGDGLAAVRAEMAALPVSITTDPTLSISGVPADAAAIGALIGSIGEAVDAINAEVV